MLLKNHEYKKLLVWQKGMELVVMVYKLVELLPQEEKFALSDQIRRASISIPSNIAEGYGRMSAKEITHFLSISRGSAYEVDTQLMIGKELGFFQESELQPAFELLTEITKMLTTLIKKLQNV